ncbi:hypothetical protein QRD02_01435 [Aequorivita sp. SDUM287046]|uniref:Uncharacterized protein n=1 Tax=Aequorivita aurantiaca TaxID=3053356 RepID=A0ABT8DCZ0_9FLAO|nr:hypothetical protein [Aequorivita aurantiaca]
MNEEENSNKLPQATFAFVIEKLPSNFESLQFLKYRKSNYRLDSFNYSNVFLEVVSPPPRTA